MISNSTTSPFLSFKNFIISPGTGTSLDLEITCENRTIPPTFLTFKINNAV